MQGAALGVRPPAGPAREPVLRSDPYHAVGGLGPVQGAGRGPFHDLEAGDVLRVEVVDAGGLLAAGVDRQRLAVVLDANAVHVVDRLRAERTACLAPGADGAAPADPARPL